MKHTPNREVFFKHIAQTTEFPMAIEIEKAEGIYQYSPEGKQYMDLISGIAVSNLGHKHPEIVKAVQNQAEKFMHVMVYGEFIESPQTKLAQNLAQILPSNLDNVFFVNSGSEAVEAALKLAKRYTGKNEIFSFKNCYHGSSHGSLSLISDKKYTRKFQPLLPNIKHLDFNNIEQLERITDKTAAVIIEPIQGEAGIIKANEIFIHKLRSKCTEHNCLLIFDEIQTGIGRTGKMFAFEHYNIVPDVLLLAKAFGGGMPLGATISSKEIMHVFTNNPLLGHISTFGGHPVSAAAANANLNVLLREKYIDEAEKKGLLFERLANHPKVKEIRRIGLMMALEIGDYDLVLKIIHKATENGLILDWFLFNNTSIRITPPLIINNDEIELAIEKITKILDSI